MKHNLSEKMKRMSLESALYIADHVMELLMNYLVLLCVLTSVAAAGGALESPLGYWLILLPVPFYYWILREKVQHLSFFLLLHLPAVILVGLIGSMLRHGRILWMVMLLAAAVVYTVNSIYTRVREKKLDSLPAGLAGLLAAAAFFFCGYSGQETASNRIMVFVLVYVFLWLLRSYVQYFKTYLITNRNAAGAMPERSILQISIKNVLVISTAATAALAALVWSPVSGWLTAGAKKVGFLFLKALALLISLIAREPEEEEAILETVEQEIPQQMGAMAEVGETPLWAQILEWAFYALAWLLVIALIVLLVVSLARYLMEGFYEKRGEKKEILREGFLEEEERIGKKREIKQSRLPSLGGTPEQKVRRIFWKAVLAEYEKLGDQKPDRSQTARQFAEKFGGGNAGGGSGAGIGQRASADSVGGAGSDRRSAWDELAALYEKARYANGAVTKEDCRRAAALARQVRR